MRVGVVGLGGLGHMAVKFLKAFGCEASSPWGWGWAPGGPETWGSGHSALRLVRATPTRCRPCPPHVCCAPHSAPAACVNSRSPRALLSLLPTLCMLPQVTVISTSESKREEALNRLGAHKFIISRNAEEVRRGGRVGKW